jgi:hypothetical protein
VSNGLGWPEATRRNSTVGRRGEGDGADRRTPHGNDVRERRRLCPTVQGRREYAFQQIRQHGLSRVGRAGTQLPAGCIGPARPGLGRMNRNPKKIPFRIKIKFLNIPRLWKFAQGDLGGILTCGCFLNYSSLLKYFRKMKYAMPSYATLGKIN